MSGVWGPNQFFTPKVTNTITFVDTPAAAQTIFTVTGDVIVKIIPVCTTDVTSAAAANVRLGVVGSDQAMIADTVATTIDAREIWHDAGSDSEIEALGVAKEYIITDGNNIILTPDGQVDLGTIIFYCDWVPLSADGNVV